MLNDRDALKLTLARTILRSLPIPGRNLENVLRTLGVSDDAIETPSSCQDRWGDFRILIKDPKEPIERHIYFQGYFEWRESRFVRQCLREGDTFFDVGANIGWFTMLGASMVKETGCVIALEPLPSSYGRLVENCSLNGFSNTRLLNVAVGKTAGKASIYASARREAGAASLFPSADEGVDDRHVVDLRTLDELVDSNKIRHARLCKIDIEGSEVDALAGMDKALRRKVFDFILIEVNEGALRRAGHRAGELKSMIEGAGYTMRDIRSPTKAIASGEALPPFGNYVCAA